MAYVMRLANRASALTLLRPATALPTACLAPMSGMSPRQEAATEHFFKKNKSLNRPLSPHLGIYKQQITMVLSLTHRVTGIGMTAFVYGMGLMPLVCSHHFPHYVEALRAMEISPVLTFPVKLGLAFALCYHTFNGVRHMAWDLGLGFAIKELYATGYFVVALSLVGAAILAFK
uniref:Truncated succinate dehydrogenase cytochrome b subunit n=1 Tax=Amblyomma variegatum TaxID=34610 RepID=F0J9U4_AMBVA|nr:TPA_inf: truncated succinate dehydrogenase cytochrome b subunit [Amblyomma variegatum]